MKRMSKGTYLRVKHTGTVLEFSIAELSLRTPKVFASQILRCYLTKEGRVRKFFYWSIWIKNVAFENLKGSHVRKFLGFRKLS